MISPVLIARYSQALRAHNETMRGVQAVTEELGKANDREREARAELNSALKELNQAIDEESQQ